MKISSRIKQVLSISLVSVLAATVMPSTVSAEPQEYYYDDSVVTVEVDLGDGGGGDTGCLGISTLELPDSTLRARFDQLKPGISDPTTIDYLAWYYGSSDDEFTNEDLEDYLVWLQTLLDSESVGGGQFALDPTDATVENLISISYTLSNGGFLSDDISGPNGEPDGKFTGDDLRDEFVTESHRTYVSDFFSVGFDASDCLDSDDVGLLLTARGYLKRWNDEVDEWDNADIDDEVSSSVEDRGAAHLRLRPNLFGGLISVPYRAAQYAEVLDDGLSGGGYYLYDYWSPISFGDEGEPEMRAVISIFGANPTGKYQTKFYYILDVAEEDYFDGLYYFLGGPEGQYEP